MASVNYVLQERLEREKKEKQKLKEKERKQRRRMEGKPVTKKEREAESRRQIQLAALQEQGNCVSCMTIFNYCLPPLLGMIVPEKGQGEKKKVVYGSRLRNRKEKGEPGMWLVISCVTNKNVVVDRCEYQRRF